MRPSRGTNPALKWLAFGVLFGVCVAAGMVATLLLVTSEPSNSNGLASIEGGRVARLAGRARASRPTSARGATESSREFESSRGKITGTVVESDPTEADARKDRDAGAADSDDSSAGAGSTVRSVEDRDSDLLTGRRRKESAGAVEPPRPKDNEDNGSEGEAEEWIARRAELDRLRRQRVEYFAHMLQLNSTQRESYDRLRAEVDEVTLTEERATNRRLPYASVTAILATERDVNERFRSLLTAGQAATFNQLIVPPSGTAPAPALNIPTAQATTPNRRR